MVRSDWSKEWPNPQLPTRTVFLGVSLDALKFLHRQRHILFHGHEPLDTDMTPTLEGEYRLMHNGCTQAEGVANLNQGAGDRLPDSDRLSQIRRRAGRLCSPHCHLPGGLEVRRVGWRAAGGAVRQEGQKAPVGRQARHACAEIADSV